MELESWTAQTIPECFEKVLVRNPEAPAVVSGGRTVTYGELAREVALLADALLSEGVVPGDRVALLLPDDIPLIVGWLGVLKAGAVCVPLSVEHPEERLRSIVSDAEPKTLVTHGALLDLARRVRGERGSIVNLDRLPAPRNQVAERLAITSESYAYLLYTSGTTGRPKGVIQTHRNLLKNVHAFSELMDISSEDRLVGLTAFSMGQGVATMFVSLLNGATLYPYNLRLAGLASLTPWLEQERISIYTSSVTLFRQFAGCVQAGVSFPHLRIIRLGTEELRLADVELFKSRFPRGCVLLNCLGSTETFNYARFRIDHDTLISDKAVPVGLPPEGTTLSILNEEGNECREGEVGEIVAYSAYLSPGYWRDDALTADRFRGEGKGRSYRTGDTGRRLPDGSIAFAGRLDHQVKIRGNRIELGEVEHALTNQPGVAGAAVIAHQDGGAEMALMAHVVTQLPEWEIRAYLRSRLPDFMMPSVVRTIDALPLTPSGKVDREALRRQKVFVENKTAFPEEGLLSEWEMAMAACWSRVLGGYVPGLHDEFMMVGGDSLKALRLFAEIRASMGVMFDSSDVSEAFTVASMARTAETRTEAPQVTRAPLVLEWNADWNFLVRVQAGDEAHPIIIVPGGWGDETEILLLAGVVSALQTSRAIYAVRSRAMDDDWPVAGSLSDHAAAVLQELRPVIAEKKWTLIGECVASAVAMEVACQAEAQGFAPEAVTMLDPLTPPRSPWIEGIEGKRMEVPESEQIKNAPDKVRNYYRLMRNSPVGRIRSDLQVILASDAKNSDHALEYWGQCTGGQLHLRAVRGTHESYLRSDGAETATLLNQHLFGEKNHAVRA
ncbi:amino acid adenylation domain-containing protein [Roseimicrobium gellanilyticum]|uniref:Amino acid adenylation domain-containing protein n=1 Tax=Roseimicrobium gellanilyticum TaxID=748857 RepID=A0A366HNK2_9BACT|nr:AMP-binding protein [Roseimicrobium gellanilyticum]RBP43811.1 amino acid adenylation domain-containing protein [Roseimicrobium gellanilyticum]